MRLFKVPIYIQILIPGQWHLSRKRKVVYITFDDGPHPETTPRILDLLETYGAKATFFCLGKNVELYEKHFSSIKKSGHAVGNHTFSHLNGMFTPTWKYLDDIEKANHAIHSDLFRPPYGRIRPKQFFALLDQYEIVFWDVMSYDFDKKVSITKSVEKLKQHTKNGSIVVFHENDKSKERVTVILNEYLKFLDSEGYRCEDMG